MSFKVKVGTRCNSFELAPLCSIEFKLIFNIDGALGVMRQLLFRVFKETQTIWIDSKIGVPSQTSVDPILVPLFIGTGNYKIFHLHLLKLTSAEDEVTGSNLVTEGFTDLTNSKRWLFTRCGRYVFKVNEDSLRSFWAQVCESRFILDGPKKCLE